MMTCPLNSLDFCNEAAFQLLAGFQLQPLTHLFILLIILIGLCKKGGNQSDIKNNLLFNPNDHSEKIPTSILEKTYLSDILRN